MKKHRALLNFKGLYGEKKDVVGADFIHIEALSKRSKIYDWEIGDHLHTDLFQLFLLRKGSGNIRFEGGNSLLRAPCAVTIPINTIHGFSFDPSTRGEVITVSESFLEGILSDFPFLILEIQKLRIYQMEEKNQTNFQSLIHQLEEELTRPTYEQFGLKPSLILLFISIYRLVQEEKLDQIVSKNPSLRLFNEFQRLIRRSIKEMKQVNYYASELGITPVHLNRVCRTITQQTALKLIHEKLIEESKKYLLNTEYSISEICYQLNFADPAHFTKIFKKYVGVTPSEFRK